MRGFSVRALAVGLLVLAAVSVGAGAASAKSIGACSAQGQYATCVTSGTVNYPASISVTVTASPNQTVYVAWDDTCSKGSGAGGKSGDFTAQTPVTRTIGHPYDNPDQCIVSADAQLQNGGDSIHVAINSPALTPPPPPQIKGNDGKCVDDLGNSSANGTKIVLWSCTGSAAQKWSYEKSKLVHDGRCLTDTGASGSKVILNACSSAKDDLWTHKANGEYVLAAYGGKLCLNDPSSTSNGTQLDVYTCKDSSTQRWTLP